MTLEPALRSSAMCYRKTFDSRLRKHRLSPLSIAHQTAGRESARYGLERRWYRSSRNHMTHTIRAKGIVPSRKPLSISDVYFSPIRRGVTSFTRLPERSTMNVLLAMAVVAVGRKFQVHRVLGRMARLAPDLLVSARQRILGLSRMVVPPAPPPVRIVAISAPGTKAPHVLVLVAFFASHRLVLIR